MDIGENNCPNGVYLYDNIKSIDDVYDNYSGRWQDEKMKCFISDMREKIKTYQFVAIYQDIFDKFMDYLVAYKMIGQLDDEKNVVLLYNGENELLQRVLIIPVLKVSTLTL